MSSAAFSVLVFFNNTSYILLLSRALMDRYSNVLSRDSQDLDWKNSEFTHKFLKLYIARPHSPVRLGLQSIPTPPTPPLTSELKWGPWVFAKFFSGGDRLKMIERKRLGLKVEQSIRFCNVHITLSSCKERARLTLTVYKSKSIPFIPLPCDKQSS